MTEPLLTVGTVVSSDAAVMSDMPSGRRCVFIKMTYLRDYEQRRVATCLELEFGPESLFWDLSASGVYALAPSSVGSSMDENLRDRIEHVLKCAVNVPVETT